MAHAQTTGQAPRILRAARHAVSPSAARDGRKIARRIHVAWVDEAPRRTA
jgi:hypothetical protein